MKLFLVQDDDRPMYVLAADFNAALRVYRERMLVEDPELRPQDVPDPKGIQWVADADEVLIAEDGQ